MPEADRLMYLGRIYDGDYGTKDGRTIWKFVIVTFENQTYVVENYPTNESVVKKLV